MPPLIALLAYFTVILLLIWYDGKRNGKCSFVLWIAIIWFFILSSRPVGNWFHQIGLLDSIAQVEEGSLANQISDSIIIIFSFVVLFRRDASIYNFYVNNKFLVLFYIYCGLSIFWSDYPFVSFKRYIRSIGNILVVLVVLSERDVIISINKVMRRCAIIFIPLSVCVFKYFHDIGRGYDFWTGKLVFIGAATDKNALGRTCMIFGIFYIWGFLYELKNIYRDSRSVLIQLVICAFLFWLFLMSNSVTSSICFLVGIIILIAFKVHFFRKNTKNLGIILLSSMLLFIVSEYLFNITEKIVASFGRNMTFTERDLIWKTLLNMGTNQWIGTGFESFWLGYRLEYVFNKLGYMANEAHNGFLEVYLNLGIVGIILVGALLHSIFKNIRNRFSDQYSFAVLGLVFLIVFIFYNLTEAAIRGTYFLWSVILLVGIDYGGLVKTKNSTLDIERPR